jgi:3-deoxy-7-phosphoheptulonate synthase
MDLDQQPVGADGLLVEVHPRPDDAVCDGPQSLATADFAGYVERVQAAAAVAGKTLSSARPLAEMAG